MTTISVANRQRKPLQALLVFVAMSVIIVLTYLPGLSGPYTLDDNSNLLSNSALKITELSGEALKKAAFSVRSGPTYRPLSMVTFAINYYFAGGFDNPAPYKITNVAIHIVNSALVFWFVYLLTGRLVSEKRLSFRPFKRHRPRAHFLVSATIALTWAISPIHLTSILYVVQRMSSLASMFVLLALISYLVGRDKLVKHDKTGLLFVFGLTPLLGLAGVFAKENGALFPIYILAIELTIFRHDTLWNRWCSLPRISRSTGILFIALIIISLVYLAYVFSSQGYISRPFTVGERLLTESRVLVFYLSLILVPRINEFGLHHDDIAISHSLIDPWTTIPAILLLASLLVVAIIARKRYPLLSLGIFLFFSAHLLESTIYPLDIAYEHRNYFASLGVWLALFNGIILIWHRTSIHGVIALTSIYILLLGATTFVRATQWSSASNLYIFETLHHPDSAILNFELAGLLESKGEHIQAVNAARKAVSLDPTNLAFRIFLSLLLSRNNLPLDQENNRTVQKLLLNETITPTTYLLLKRVVSCSSKDCTSLLPIADKWLYTLVNYRKRKHLSQEFNHMYGVVKYNEGDLATAEKFMLRAIKLDPRYIPAYLDLATIYGNTGNSKRAIEVINTLKNIDPANSAHYAIKIQALSH